MLLIRDMVNYLYISVLQNGLNFFLASSRPRACPTAAGGD
jgi:hypothetical protein